eukprot:jgi/Mesvir1/20596/Mv14830-RA.1
MLVPAVMMEMGEEYICGCTTVALWKRGWPPSSSITVPAYMAAFLAMWPAGSWDAACPSSGDEIRGLLTNGPLKEELIAYIPGLPAMRIGRPPGERRLTPQPCAVADS